jgi:glycosyltransferase involved in cell wall biosynthesis
LASDVAPVREVIEQGRTGLLGAFFDVDGLADQALRLLRDPMQYRVLGRTGRAFIEQDYSLAKTVPQFLTMLNKVVRK